MSNPNYIGRFAPSPTGPLHFGSLLAALASYLDAKSQQGTWLVRIEDLDPPREDPTAANAILRILDDYQLHWDGRVVYQSQQHAHYQAALEQLIAQNRAFPCQCTRKQLSSQHGKHFGRCSPPTHADFAWRFLASTEITTCHDRLQPSQIYAADQLGDCVIRRRDHYWSYQLAVVVDDALSGVTDVVRGIDLIDSTPWQQQLQYRLGYATPRYAHIPVATEANGQKLSKQNFAKPLTSDDSGATLWQALHWLRQDPPLDLQNSGNALLLQWAIEHWQIHRLQQCTQLSAPPHFQNPL
ncbi:MAG: tRNA glutamyl-Q(34) synthetase GluQRS [Bacterioplanes sp.]|nr:tRNA glutamyl-Q(34) synthetase GluQRS [Bacterioplanes sp.]